MSEALARDIAALLGGEAVRSGEAVARLDPGWHQDNLKAGLVAAPTDTAGVARLLAWCAARGIGVVPQGGRTGLVAGGVSAPGEVVLSLARMDRIAPIDRTARTATVEAGVTLARLQQAALAVGLDPGIDTASRGSATIGGMVATNAGGIRAFRHGVMRHRLLGLEAVLADGTVLSDLTTVLKTSAGPDVKHLFCGSEGTLGVVTRAAIRLEPAPGPRATALVGLPDAAAGLAIVAHFLAPDGDASLLAAEIMTGGFANGSALAHGLEPARLGLGDPVNLIVEVGAATEARARAALEDGLGGLNEAAAIGAAVIAASLAQRDAIWLIREASDAVGRAYGFELWYDVSVPLPGIDAYLARCATRLATIDRDLELEAIGHLADGNLHILVARKTPLAIVPHAAIEAALYDGLAAQGGSFSAEHGIGSDKRDALARYADPGKLAVMRRLKAALDPNGILNRGKVLP